MFCLVGPHTNLNINTFSQKETWKSESLLFLALVLCNSVLSVALVSMWSGFKVRLWHQLFWHWKRFHLFCLFVLLFPSLFSFSFCGFVVVVAERPDIPKRRVAWTSRAAHALMQTVGRRWAKISWDLWDVCLYVEEVPTRKISRRFLHKPANINTHTPT